MDAMFGTNWMYVISSPGRALPTGKDLAIFHSILKGLAAVCFAAHHCRSGEM
jgi:hypothetical protein